MHHTLPAWGKYESETAFHRLEHHCADVAACFEALIADDVLGARFARAAGSGQRLDPVMSARLAVVAFLHDFAKLNAGFQFRVRDPASLPPDPPPRMSHVVEAFYCVEQADICEALGLYGLLAEWGDGVNALLLGALSHHGRPPQQPHAGSGPRIIWEPFAGYAPVRNAALLRKRAEAWFPTAFERGPVLSASPALAHLFAGVVALADQIGSDRERHFPFEPREDPDYIKRARRQARQAIAGRGLRRADWRASAGADFRTMFGHPAPRPLQTAVQNAPLDAPLLILESDTGSGKTEAAVLRFAALLKAGLVDGLYFAVPTRAAARQLHDRVRRAVSALLPSPWANLTALAVPGYCQMGEASGRPIGGYEVYWEDAPDEAERVARWSAESARHFLSAPAAVGTVDQALLAGLKIKWAHLRGAALSRSLLVIDEVHASDAYMTELLATLLDGHLAVGGHALLMSATLGAAARARLTSGHARFEMPTASQGERAPYPCLTLAGPAETRLRPIPGTPRTRAVSMEARPWLADTAAIARTALEAAEEGAKVLVIRNTVASAQALLDELANLGTDSLGLRVNGIATLHHGRFAVEDRRLLDTAVETALGKHRPAGACIVIGTQTLEQSLDIDADMLLTDLCPVDVLLQRIGRLHRHNNARPRGYAQPRCIVLTPADGLEEGLDGSLMPHGLGLRRGSPAGGIYRNLLGVEQTRRLIALHPVWHVPRMNRMLVEQATNPIALEELARRLGGAWVEHEVQTFGIGAAEAQVARRHRLDRREPFDEDLAFADLDEAVRTRLGEDGPRFQLSRDAVGPFGTNVRTFNLPAHLFRGEMPSLEEIEAASLERGTDGGTLRIGAHAFRYDRAGIRRAGNAAGSSDTAPAD